MQRNIFPRPNTELNRLLWEWYLFQCQNVLGIYMYLVFESRDLSTRNTVTCYESYESILYNYIQIPKIGFPLHLLLSSGYTESIYDNDNILSSVWSSVFTSMWQQTLKDTSSACCLWLTWIDILHSKSLSVQIKVQNNDYTIIRHFRINDSVHISLKDFFSAKPVPKCLSKLYIF